MRVKPYERLSRVYDLNWEDFSLRYVDLIEQLLKEHPITQARIIDLGCGTGSLAVELAKLGHVVFGVDVSPHMIEVARSKSKEISNIFFEV